MRRLVAACVTAALLAGAAGCGGGDEGVAAVPTAPPGDYGPAKAGSGTPKRPDAPPKKPPSAAVAQALAAGQVGVVGVEGVVGVRPRAIDVAADGTMQDITWTNWGTKSAEGTGRLRSRDCDPSCASGDIDMLPARIRLSRPRVCGRASYFDRAVVTLDEGPQPQSYVRAPC